MALGKASEVSDEHKWTMILTSQKRTQHSIKGSPQYWIDRLKIESGKGSLLVPFDATRCPLVEGTSGRFGVGAGYLGEGFCCWRRSGCHFGFVGTSGTKLASKSQD